MVLKTQDILREIESTGRRGRSPPSHSHEPGRLSSVERNRERDDRGITEPAVCVDGCARPRVSDSMANVETRQYEASDLGRCRSLWAEMTQRHREIYEDPSIGGDNPGLEFDGHLDQVGAERVWVAVLDGDVVGLTSLIQDGEQAEVEPVVVSSRHRGKGIGQALLDRAIEEAKKLGVLCLGAKPVARNEDAISFFYDAGFKTLGHIHLFMWLGESTPGMWKPGPELFGKQFDY